jgi:hypothetical protein
MPLRSSRRCGNSSKSLNCGGYSVFYYRLYFFNSGRIQSYHDFRADSDAEAQVEAERHARYWTVELWRGSRLIATIEPQQRYG